MTRSSGMRGNDVLGGVDYGKTLFSPRWFMENVLCIVDKQNRLVKFRLNQEQDTLLQHVEFCLANDLPVRMIVLKARQIGATTFFVALGYWLAAMNKNISYGIVAHRLDSAESIFRKCKIFYNNSPKELQPGTTQMSGEGITFDKKGGRGINSKIQFATVNEGVFRGQTLTYLHLSECAFWEGDVQAIENSLAPTVSINPRTFIVRESTANGYNFFKDDWDRAVQRKSEYTPFFFGWQTHREYRMDPPKGFVLTRAEEILKAKFQLDDAQIMWRRYQIDNYYSGNAVWFMQENPMTPTEAFIASGAGVFDAQTIADGYAGCVAPMEMEITSHPTFERLKIWEEPQITREKIHAQKAVWSDDEQKYVYVDTDLIVEERMLKTPYTIGIDTSGMGADFNQITVVNNITKAMAARYGKKNISEEALAKIAVEIAKMYNDALIAPEVNYSHEIGNYIIKEGYKNLYITESVSRQDLKLVGGIEYGWKTTTLTKPQMISALRSAINANPGLIKDKEFWFEAEYFIMEDVAKNIMNAAGGHHDDIIISTAIAMYVSNSFQAQQTRMVIREPIGEDSIFNIVKKRKKNPIRKGIYSNHA